MPNKIYTAPETAVVFSDAGDVAITLANLANAAGRVSARYDRGAGSKAKLHSVRCIIQWNATVVAGAVVEIYLFTSDGTYADGTVGTANAAFATDKRRNGILIGCVVADQTSATVDTIATFRDLVISERYYSIGVWNGSGVALKSTSGASRIIVTPTPDELQ
jgi:hypothetical protein